MLKKSRIQCTLSLLGVLLVNSVVFGQVERMTIRTTYSNDPLWTNSHNIWTIGQPYTRYKVWENGTFTNIYPPYDTKTILSFWDNQGYYEAKILPNKGNIWEVARNGNWSSTKKTNIIFEQQHWRNPQIMYSVNTALLYHDQVNSNSFDHNDIIVNYKDWNRDKHTAMITHQATPGRDLKWVWVVAPHGNWNNAYETDELRFRRYENNTIRDWVAKVNRHDYTFTTWNRYYPNSKRREMMLPYQSWDLEAWELTIWSE